MLKVQKTAFSLTASPNARVENHIISRKSRSIGRFNKIKEISGTENVDCRFMVPDSTVVRYVECRLGPGRLTLSPNVECRCCILAGISSVECSCINGSKIIYTLHLHSTYFYRAPSLPLIITCLSFTSQSLTGKQWLCQTHNLTDNKLYSINILLL